MGNCVFCGSPEAKWPNDIENSHIVKNTPLCNHHLFFAIKTCVVEEYDPSEFLSVQRWNAAVDDLFSILDDWARSKDPDGREEEGNIFGQIISLALNPIKRKEMGPPIRKAIDESEFSRWLCLRLTDLARRQGGKIYRCSAYKQGSPDQRCVNNTKENGGMCDLCKKKNARFGDASFYDAKINRCLDILTGKAI